ncbi:MAG: 6-carboxytetrahydropterin synthase QueD [Coriobacteriales bacterium]|jgi:queuosine biosynthesis protein QueD|nr:6-carboxytetrahydropterin synthase QueD [Coriobacteriales bacterium]
MAASTLQQEPQRQEAQQFSRQEAAQPSPPQLSRQEAPQFSSPQLSQPASIDRALLHTDGGSRGNPGASGIGFTIEVDDGRELMTICRGGAFIGEATNNVAEYRALIWGLRNACALGVRTVDIFADSELLVKQVRGEYRVKSEGIKPLFSEVRLLLEGFASYTIKHVMREDNGAADALANEAMDSRGMVGDFAEAYGAGDLFSALTVPALTAAPVVEPAAVPAADIPTSGTHEPSPRPTAAEAAFTAQPPQPNSPDISLGTTATEKGNAMTSTPAHGSYTLTIKEHFDAAHALVGYPGECRNLHGHTWDIEVSVKGVTLDEVGIVYDFKDLKRNLLSILDRYDHKYLNEVAPFDTMNATAENLARVIYEQMEALLPEGILLVEVAVWESPIAKLTYTRQ